MEPIRYDPPPRDDSEDTTFELSLRIKRTKRRRGNSEPSSSLFDWLKSAVHRALAFLFKFKNTTLPQGQTVPNWDVGRMNTPDETPEMPNPYLVVVKPNIGVPVVPGFTVTTEVFTEKLADEFYVPSMMDTVLNLVVNDHTDNKTNTHLFRIDHIYNALAAHCDEFERR